MNHTSPSWLWQVVTRLFMVDGGRCMQRYKKQDALRSFSYRLPFTRRCPCEQCAMTTVDSSSRSSSMEVTPDVHEALLKACRKSDLEVFTRLLPEISNINYADAEKETALHHSATSGASSIVKLLLAHPDIDVNARDSAGHTPLIHAALKGRVEVSRLLVNHPRVDPNVQDEHSDTALTYASWKNYTEVVLLLLTGSLSGMKSINFNLRNQHGCTALVLAACYGHTEVVRLLLTHRRAGWDKQRGHVDDASDGGGAVPAEGMDHEKEENEEKEGEAMEHTDEDIDINFQDTHGCTPLIYASLNNHVEMVSLLLDRKELNPNLQDVHGATGLTYAALKGHLDIVRLLLSVPNLGVNLRQSSKNGLAPIAIAAREGHLEIVELLLAHPANAKGTTTRHRDQALILASLGGYTLIVSLLLSHAKEHGGGEININAQGEDGDTALIYATWRRWVDVMRLLLDYRPHRGDGSVREGNQTGRNEGEQDDIDLTDLIEEKEGRNKEEEEEEEEEEAQEVPELDLNVRTQNGSTVLIIAVTQAYGYSELIKLILDHPAAKFIDKKQLREVLRLASSYGRTEIVKMLCDFDNTISVAV